MSDPSSKLESSLEPAPSRRRRRGFRFTVGKLLLIMLVVCMAAAGLSYLVRADQGDAPEAKLVFILFTLSSPVLLMIIVSVIRSISSKNDRS